MATNEDLAIAFLCFAEKTEKDDMKAFIVDRARGWDDTENMKRLLEAIDLPMNQIQRKIALLHTALYSCPFKKIIYEEMANRLANFVSMCRSPILKPIKKDRSFHAEPNEWIAPLSLNPQGRT